MIDDIDHDQLEAAYTSATFGVAEPDLCLMSERLYLQIKWYGKKLPRKMKKRIYGTRRQGRRFDLGFLRGMERARSAPPIRVTGTTWTIEHISDGSIDPPWYSSRYAPGSEL